MWLKPTIVITILIFLISLSVNEVVKNQRKKLLKQMPEETIPGAISQGLTYLVGVAGGIYISLIMLTSFLKIVFPESVQFFGVAVDPLAIISLLLAILQPWVIKVFNLLGNK